MHAGILDRSRQHRCRQWIDMQLSGNGIGDFVGNWRHELHRSEHIVAPGPFRRKECDTPAGRQSGGCIDVRSHRLDDTSTFEAWSGAARGDISRVAGGAIASTDAEKIARMDRTGLNADQDFAGARGRQVRHIVKPKHFARLAVMFVKDAAHDRSFHSVVVGRQATSTSTSSVSSSAVRVRSASSRMSAPSRAASRTPLTSTRPVDGTR